MSVERVACTDSTFSARDVVRLRTKAGGTNAEGQSLTHLLISMIPRLMMGSSDARSSFVMDNIQRRCCLSGSAKENERRSALANICPLSN